MVYKMTVEYMNRPKRKMAAEDSLMPMIPGMRKSTTRGNLRFVLMEIHCHDVNFWDKFWSEKRVRMRGP